MELANIIFPKGHSVMKKYKHSPLFLLSIFLPTLLLINACSLQKRAPTAAQSAIQPLVPYETGEKFGIRPSFPTPEQVFKLSQQQINEFSAYYLSPSLQQTSSNRRIFQYLKEYEKSYRYSGKTLTAEQSLIQTEGNCLSLAILTTALAKSVGVDTGYQLVDSQPVYQKEEDIILSAQHIRSLLFEPKKSPKQQFNRGQLELGRNTLIVDYFPTQNSRIRKNISESEFVAMYYKNIAADAIINRLYDDAYWLIRESFHHSPMDEQSINMMALVHEKKGFKRLAEKLYLFGLKYAENKLDLLRNYYIFLKSQHRRIDAQRIKIQLATIEVPNPFDWINLGNTSFAQNKYREAKRYYKKAAKQAPYLHQAHFGIAKSDFKMGNIRRAKASMKLAKEKAIDQNTKSLYQKKLDALSDR